MCVHMYAGKYVRMNVFTCLFIYVCMYARIYLCVRNTHV
jgi:hypothetical protein